MSEGGGGCLEQTAEVATSEICPGVLLAVTMRRSEIVREVERVRWFDTIIISSTITALTVFAYDFDDDDTPIVP